MRKNRIITLLLTLTVVIGMSQAVFAKPYEANGGQYTYREGQKQIEASVTTDIQDQIRGIEPGDSVTIKLDYTNKAKRATDWYMENEVLDTLEATASNPMNGGYTYTLKNIGPDGKETVIFDSDQVGGGANGAGDGLDQATTATQADNDQDYFFIQTLEPGETGHTELYVALDGESQINTYQEKNAEIEFRYAVEERENDVIHEPGEDIIKKIVKTGDETKWIAPAAVFIGAIVLLVLALVSRRKDRKDGDRA